MGMSKEQFSLGIENVSIQNFSCLNDSIVLRNSGSSFAGENTYDGSQTFLGSASLTEMMSEDIAVLTSEVDQCVHRTRSLDMKTEPFLTTSISSSIEERPRLKRNLGDHYIPGSSQFGNADAEVYNSEEGRCFRHTSDFASNSSNHPVVEEDTDSLSKRDISKRIISFKVDESILHKIDHSAKYMDDVFEYRFVILPRNHPFLDFDLDSELRERFLSESEWRVLGIRQTRGWEHYGYSQYECNVLLFRRAHQTDPRTGKVSSESQERVARRKTQLNMLKRKMKEYQRYPIEPIPGSRDKMEPCVISSIPIFASMQSSTYPSPVDVRTLFSPNSSSQATTLYQCGVPSNCLLNQVISRNLIAGIKDQGLQRQPSLPFLNINDLEEQRNINVGTDEEGLSCSDERQRILHEIDRLNASIHMPFFVR